MLSPAQMRFVIAYVDHGICHDFYSEEDRERYAGNRRKLLGASA